MATIISCFQEWQHLLTGTGKIGFGTNSANLIAGVFIATGQDVASIESCQAKVYMSSASSTEVSSIVGRCLIVVDLINNWSAFLYQVTWRLNSWDCMPVFLFPV